MSNAIAGHADAPALEARELCRTFVDGARRLDVLKSVSLSVKSGEIVALIGRSGSGKSTLLHLLGLLDRPDAGSVLIDGTPAVVLNENQRAELRRSHLGFVFQHYFLMPEFNVLDNVLMPARVAASPMAWFGGRRSEATARAWHLLEAVGLKDQALQTPLTLSGGERQRTALARALLLKPRVLLCDEPTGNLDPETATRIMGLIFELAQRDGVATLLVTHDRGVAERANRAVRLDQGRLTQDSGGNSGRA